MSGRNPTHGTKVTDPKAIVQESAGPVASDSLAAESQGFSTNRNSEALGVSGSNSTFANTNTSGAVRLNPATDAESREAQEDWASERSYQNALGGQDKNTQNSYQSGGSDSNAGTAPSYVNSQYVDEAGPKGKNLTEGIEGNPKNASFNQAIGGRNDPGRLAEQKFARDNADVGDMAGMPKQEGVMEDNTYESLGRNASA